MKLYKFISDPSVVEFIVDGIIKFTPISELNDPSELVPDVISHHVEESREKLRLEGYNEEDMVHLRKQEELMKRLAPEFQAIRVPSTADEATKFIKWSLYNNTQRLEELLRATAEKMSSQVALLCLTKRYDCLPMWAYYANNASGLVVEFNDLNQCFTGDETGILNEPIPVQYKKERVGITFEPNSHKSLFFSKFQDWSYEEEVRVVKPLNDCRTKILDSNKVLYLTKIPKKCISKVIFGWNIRKNYKEEITNKIKAINPSVRISEAHFERGKVELHNIPI